MEPNFSDSGSEPSKSHVHGLLRRIAASPLLIAPERAAALKELISKHKLEIYINDQGETDFNMGAMYGKVMAPMRVYHHIWAAALVFAALYIEQAAAAKLRHSEVDMDHPDIEKVWANYRLSCKCFKEGSDYPLPPNVAAITPRADYIQLADELFSKMMAFSILHEIAHIGNGDTVMDEKGKPLKVVDPHEIELAADKWAYDWILTDWRMVSADPKLFINRALGVIFCLAMMDEFRHHTDTSTASSHPNACDRLLAFFKNYEDQIVGNPYRRTCDIATYFALQLIAWTNDYLLPLEGYSDAVSFLNLVKTEGPRLAYEAEERKRNQRT